MTQREKLVARIRNSPKNVTFDELDALLRAYGFEVRRSGGSHHVYRRGTWTITVARHMPHVHSNAVRAVLAAIDELGDDE